MASSKKILGVDFDDVLVKSVEAMTRFHNTTYGTEYAPKDVVDFDLSKMWSCSIAEARARMDEFMSSDFHHNAEAVFGAHDALKVLSDQYEIVIVTGRREKTKDATIEWLKKNFIGLYREIHFTGFHEPDPQKRRLKSTVAKELGVSVFIDDAPSFAEDIASAGIPVFLFDTPWNQGPVPAGVERVFSWSEITERLLASVR